MVVSFSLVIKVVQISTSRTVFDRSDHSPKLGLRLENHSVALVVARQTILGGGSVGPGVGPSTEAGKYELTFDRVTSNKSTPLLTGGDPEPLADALEKLCERHPLRRHPLAVSLDGDFCVTRVTIASPEKMPRSINLLNERVNHYLQLGPGRKVTGATHLALDERTHYCATAVVADRVIETLYEAFRLARLNIAWVEPSLVSLARLVGRDRQFDGQAVMIADGTGDRWDIGIVVDGRLWLDYRPAGSETSEGVHRALDGHLERLQRFCRRHRKINSDLMSQVLVCGTGQKAAQAAKLLDTLDGLSARVFQIDCLDNLLVSDSSELVCPVNRIRVVGERQSQREPEEDQVKVLQSNQLIAPEMVPMVAALLPTLIGTQAHQVPDVLENVRREPPRSTARVIFDCIAPVLAASALVMASLWYQHSVRGNLRMVETEIETLQSRKKVNRVRNEQLMGRTTEIANIQRIASLAHIDQPMDLLDDVTRCLPNNTRLLSWSMDGNRKVRVSVETQEEANLYETIETLQKISRVDEINLVSTEPTPDLRGGLFVLDMWVADRLGNLRRAGNSGETQTETGQR